MTAWSGVLLKKLMFIKPLKKFPSFCETKIFITVLTTAHQQTIILTKPVYFPAPFYILKISFNNFVFFMPISSKIILQLRSPQIILYALSSPIHSKCPHTSHPSHSIAQKQSVSNTDRKSPHYAVSCIQLFPNSTQQQIFPSAPYSQTPSVYVPHSE